MVGRPSISMAQAPGGLLSLSTALGHRFLAWDPPLCKAYRFPFDIQVKSFCVSPLINDLQFSPNAIENNKFHFNSLLIFIPLFNNNFSLSR